MTQKFAHCSITRHINKKSLATAIVFLGLSSSAHALFEDDEARKAIIELRERVKIQQQQSNDRLAEIAAKLEKLEAATRGQLVLNQTLESQRNEIAKLRNELEIVSNDLANTQRRIKDYYGDIDARIRKFEPKQIEIDNRLVNVSQDETNAYETAIDAYKNSDFNAAASLLDEFNRRYPSSGYHSLALYYGGAAHFAKKDYKTAATVLQKFLDKYPNNPRAADVMLSLADSHISLKDFKTARRILEQLLVKVPEGVLAESAKKRLVLIKG
jgi:tol-pal system protein YbgF